MRWNLATSRSRGLLVGVALLLAALPPIDHDPVLSLYPDASKSYALHEHVLSVITAPFPRPNHALGQAVVPASVLCTNCTGDTHGQTGATEARQGMSQGSEGSSAQTRSGGCATASPNEGVADLGGIRGQIQEDLRDQGSLIPPDPLDPADRGGIRDPGGICVLHLPSVKETHEAGTVRYGQGKQC